MSLSKLIAPYLALSTIPTAYAAFWYPDVSRSLIEGIFVDAHGNHATGFVDAITPCSNYVSGAPNIGRMTAAQWIRVSFHDFVTHHTSDGSGGLDASIGFETDRNENAGAAMNDTMRFFRNRVNAKVSSADLLALSVTASVENCGGPQIPKRAGRVDATGPGPFGVPSPTNTLEDTLAMFGGAGINQSDAISLVACGHTLGTVHHGVFPDVVGPEAVTPDNLAGGVAFDDSPTVFDNNVVHAYIDGTGTRGGPLITTANESSRSDLRLFTSDNNATMEKHYNSGAGFVNTCATLFQRMIETVPKDVVLSDIITPQKVKPVNATLDFDVNGRLIFTGTVRVSELSERLLHNSNIFRF
ncbi:heme peroxidase [Tricladium varicosporioides]|nr:heme peroxidase [Hymenoscyphus varicosporioides]